MAKQVEDYDVKYRPRTLDDVVGQDSAVRTIRGWKHVPRVVMLKGLTGAGKTTVGKIIVNKMLRVSSTDLYEINCGTEESPIAMVRQIEANMFASTVGGDHRAWILDEVQTLSRQKFAQEALLKVLEDCPEWCFFILSTTDPQRLIKPILGRCAQVAINPIDAKAMKGLLQKIAKAEKIDPPPEDRLLDKIVDNSQGSARNAVKDLQNIAGIEDPAARFEAIGGVSAEKKAHELAFALMPFDGSVPAWSKIKAILLSLKEEDPETMRQIILATAFTWLTKPQSKLEVMAYKVIRCLDQYLTGNAGRAQLAAGCYQILHAKPQ